MRIGILSRLNFHSLVPVCRRRFILLSAAQQAEHGIGGHGGIFCGSWVEAQMVI